MKIVQSAVGLAARHEASREVTRIETLRSWVGDRPAAPRTETNIAADGPRVSISDRARALATEADARPPSTRATAATAETGGVGDRGPIDPRLGLLIRLIEAFTGQKVVLFDPSDTGAPTAGVPVGTIAPNTQPASAGWGLEYDFHESVRESESTSLRASGTVITADGQRLGFSLALDMSRSYSRDTDFSLRAGDGVRKDPLVINFDGTAAELTAGKIDFDIDGDGSLDRISFLAPGSGFLALDRNGNGRIDNGTELFGAQSGDGFADLAAFDDDGNGWIDEADAVFAELRIWSRDAAGNDVITTLADHGIGALYLGRVETPFDLKDGGNVQHGQIRSSGIYLTEQGRAGTMQQIDLIV